MINYAAQVLIVLVLWLPGGVLAAYVLQSIGDDNTPDTAAIALWLGTLALLCTNGLGALWASSEIARRFAPLIKFRILSTLQSQLLPYAAVNSASDSKYIIYLIASQIRLTELLVLATRNAITGNPRAMFSSILIPKRKAEIPREHLAQFAELLSAVVGEYDLSINKSPAPSIEDLQQSLQEIDPNLGHSDMEHMEHAMASATELLLRGSETCPI